MIPSLYIQKSFVLMGRSIDHCYGCKYCRLGDGGTAGFDMSTTPGKVNPLFRSLPVAVNLLYGDPMLQVGRTVVILRSLERDRHTGPVVVITKGLFNNFPRHSFDLDLHFAFSTFGINHPLDGGTRERLTLNLREAQRHPYYRYSIEFRPIVFDVNDSQETIDWVMDRAREFGLPVGYSGLQGTHANVARWQQEGLHLQPYPGYRFGHKKMISDLVEHRILESAVNRGVHVFRKTSCLVSYTHGLARDYNAHYYRPNEVGCVSCPIQGKCTYFKAEAPKDTSMLPYEHNVVFKLNHECVLKRNGICEFPTEDCSRIIGQVIKTDVPITTADVRVTKWLTGMTVDADFTESPWLSDFWQHQQ